MLSQHRRETCDKIVAMLLGGDLAAYAARRNGLTVDEESYIWGQFRGGRPTVPRKQTPPRSDDGWPDVLPVDDPDNDVVPEQTAKTCPNCAGRGRTHDGLTCQRCGGSGRVPLDDVDDDEDEEARNFYGYEDEE
jgi:hypothetical protein